MALVERTSQRARCTCCPVRLQEGRLCKACTTALEWVSMAKPLTRIGWTLCSFDPGFTFIDQRGSRVELTFDQVRDLVSTIDDLVSTIDDLTSTIDP